MDNRQRFSYIGKWAFYSRSADAAFNSCCLSCIVGEGRIALLLRKNNIRNHSYNIYLKLPDCHDSCDDKTCTNGINLVDRPSCECNCKNIAKLNRIGATCLDNRLVAKNYHDSLECRLLLFLLLTFVAQLQDESLAYL